MSSTVLRLGLWLTILTLVAFIFDSNFDSTPLGQLITPELLQRMFIFSGILVVLGIVLSLVEKATHKVSASKNKCRVCGTVVPSGAIYCRQHLRSILEAEDRRTHSGTTRVPKV
jgi:predicted nucleic acid-binding Zn ribbon protein